MKPATDGNRFAILDIAIKRQHRRQDALIEVLHTAQQAFGYLDRKALHYVARELRLPPSRVFGVATFYKFFTLKPAGKHTCVVCLGTACYVKRSFELVHAAQKQAGTPPGTTTPDGEITLLTSRCMGACGIAPVAVYDGTVVGHQTCETVTKQIVSWKSRGYQPAS